MGIGFALDSPSRFKDTTAWDFLFTFYLVLFGFLHFLFKSTGFTTAFLHRVDEAIRCCACSSRILANS
jgi:hypothetical protein